MNEKLETYDNNTNKFNNNISKLNNNSNNNNLNKIDSNKNNYNNEDNSINNSMNFRNDQSKEMAFNKDNNNNDNNNNYNNQYLLNGLQPQNFGINKIQMNTMNQQNLNNNPMINLGSNWLNNNSQLNIYRTQNFQNVNNNNLNNNFNINNNNMNEVNNFIMGQHINRKNYGLNDINSPNKIEEDKKNIKYSYLKKIYEFTKPPLIGLENIESHSYMTAVLQCLSNINYLIGYFLTNKPLFTNNPFHFKEKPISKAFSDVIYYLWNQNESNKMSIYYFQNLMNLKNINDAKDLLLFLFETMHKELNSLKNNQIIDNEISDKRNAEYEFNKFLKNYFNCNKSIISDFFHFTQVNFSTCNNCKITHYNFQIDNKFIFSIEKMLLFKKQNNINFSNISLKDFFDYYINPEQSLDNSYCNSCNTESAHITEKKFGTFPEIMIIILERNPQIKYEFNFIINHILVGLDDYLIKLNCNKLYFGIKYQLIGIIFYIFDSGMNSQYSTYCKSPVDSKWYWFNDSNVQKIADPAKESKGIPYLLFYQKIDNENLYI